MDTSSIANFGSLKRLLSGRTYRRLNGGYTVKKKKNLRVLRLGGNVRRSWKIRGIPKQLQLNIKFPMKIFRKLRDGYVDMMLRFAGSVGYLEDAKDSKHVFGEKRIPRGQPIPSVSKLAEFDKNLVLQIYNSIAASREFVSL